MIEHSLPDLYSPHSDDNFDDNADGYARILVYNEVIRTEANPGIAHHG